MASLIAAATATATAHASPSATARAAATSHLPGPAIDGIPVILLAAVAVGILALIIYLAYKLTFKADYGMPVRRRVFLFHMKVIRDQAAEVPIWWSNLQVQRAVSAYWKKNLRESVHGGPGPAAQA